VHPPKILAVGQGHNIFKNFRSLFHFSQKKSLQHQKVKKKQMMLPWLQRIMGKRNMIHRMCNRVKQPRIKPGRATQLKNKRAWGQQSRRIRVDTRGRLLHIWQLMLQLKVKRRSVHHSVLPEGRFLKNYISNIIS
jgi:hypothetical protein